jgi:hypothetical protein
MSSFLLHTAQAKHYDKNHRVEKKLDFTLTSFGMPVPIFSVIFSSTSSLKRNNKTTSNSVYVVLYSWAGNREITNSNTCINSFADSTRGLGIKRQHGAQ